MQAATRTFTLSSPDAMGQIAAQCADVLRPGDTLLLSGPVGAGKSTFARAVIQHRLGRAEDVPSPTFTLVQVYDDDICEIWHCDLYRLTDPSDVMELGLDAAFDTAICLIEWPDRLSTEAPKDALLLEFSAGMDAHTITFSVPQRWADHLSVLHD